MSALSRQALPSPWGKETPLQNLAGRKGLHPEDFAFGTKASTQGRVSQSALHRLEHLHIKTQEELLGYIEVHSKDSHLDKLLESSPQEISQLKSYLQATSNREITSHFEKAQTEAFAFGLVLSRAIAADASNPVGATVTAPSEDSHLISGQCLPPIKDQGDRTTCVAFATCAVIEYAYCIHHGQTLDLSEEFQFWNCKQNDGDPVETGTWPDVSFALVGALGICDETEWPYDYTVIPGNISHDPPGPSARIDPRLGVPPAAFTHVTAALTITPTDVAKIQGYISSGYAVAVGIPVYRSWYNNPYVRVSGNIRMPEQNDVREGGHAFALVGWANDSTVAGGGYFIVRNSWGTRWGTQSVFGPGHGTIPFAYIRDHNRYAHTVKV
jgi:C1A family cysteine protease